jgi:hypothetical protein
MDCFHSASVEALCIRSAFDTEQVALECLNGARCPENQAMQPSKRLAASSCCAHAHEESPDSGYQEL